MQTTSLRFRQLAQGYVRPLSWGLKASFDKALDDTVTLFTLDVSILDGPDVLGQSDNNPIQAWDKYSYVDYSDRVISLEVTHEESEPYSVTQGYADVTLNNYDGYFTPNGGSPIDSFILPRRPFRILMGFENENLSQIVGLTDGMPKIDKARRTASFHIIDFMSYLYDQDIGETIILEDVKTHEVLDYLFTYLGLDTDQYVLDNSLNTIKFFYVEKGTKFGDIASKLMEAEIGRLYLSEQGIVTFGNRYNYNLNAIYEFNSSNVIDYSIDESIKIINKVKIRSEVREVQALQSVWTGSITDHIPAGSSYTLFVDFSDPITTIVNPAYSATEIATSYFTSALNQDGTGTYSDFSLTSLTLFSKSAKLMFSNDGASDAYITSIDLYGTPAKIEDVVKIEEIDQDSIDDFEEQIYEIDNEYIQDASNAQSRALLLIRDYKDYGTVIDVEVKGTPALQLGDRVSINVDNISGDFVIIKKTNILDGKMTQRLRLREKEQVVYFTLDQSILDGNDLLGI